MDALSGLRLILCGPNSHPSENGDSTVLKEL